MENHPIPQDITGFQFKLIGDMTIKQFAYLGAGIVLGWIFFAVLPFTILKVLVGGFFAISGFAVAFFPVAGRPLDTMATNYIKALFAPTQYVYQKTGIKMRFPQAHQAVQMNSRSFQAPSPRGDDKLKQYLSTISQKPQNKYDEKELAFFQSLSSAYGENNKKHTGVLQDIFSPQAHPKIITVVPAVKDKPKGISEIPFQEKKPEETSSTKSPTDKKGEESSSSDILVLQKKLAEAKLLEVAEKGTVKYESAHKKVLELEKLLNEVQSKKLALENQIQELQKKIELQNQNIMVPGIVKPRAESQTIKKIPLSMAKSKGAPIVPDVPNLVSGIVKDPRGNPLPNILVEIKDSHGNPVRAFKTNVVGQFASATPLSNGSYTISFEDPKNLNKFDQVEINVTGQVMLPLEIASVDIREELRRSLFNTPSGGNKN